jgi:hypothetical protein
MTTEQLEQIDARANAATEGPWYTVGPPWLPSDMPTWVQSGSEDPHARTAIICEPPVFDIDISHNHCDANMAFVAHAREDVPALIAEIRCLNTVIDGMMARLWALVDGYDLIGMRAIAEDIRKAIMETFEESKEETTSGQ